jgi:hypothetical protein
MQDHISSIYCDNKYENILILNTSLLLVEVFRVNISRDQEICQSSCILHTARQSVPTELNTDCFSLRGVVCLLDAFLLPIKPLGAMESSRRTQFLSLKIVTLISTRLNNFVIHFLQIFIYVY